MYRLTVHVTDVPRVEVRTGKKIKTAAGKWVDEVKQKIVELSPENINDQNVVKFLTLTKMINEIKKEIS